MQSSDHGSHPTATSSILPTTILKIRASLALTAPRLLQVTHISMAGRSRGGHCKLKIGAAQEAGRRHGCLMREGS